MRRLHLALLVANVVLAAAAWRLHQLWTAELDFVQQRHAAQGLTFESAPSSWRELYSEAVYALLAVRAADSSLAAMRAAIPGEEIPVREGATYAYGSHRWVVRDGRWHRLVAAPTAAP